MHQYIAQDQLFRICILSIPSCAYLKLENWKIFEHHINGHYSAIISVENNRRLTFRITSRIKVN